MKTTQQILNASPFITVNHPKYYFNVGRVVRHNGDNSRHGMRGYVTRATENGICVQWTVTSGGNAMGLGEIQQNYSIDWARRHIQAAHTATPSCLMPCGSLPSARLPAISVPAPRDERQYIIWSPSGATPPKKIVVGFEMAKETAFVMAHKHGKDFYACELVAKAQKIVQPTVEVVEL